MKKIFICSPYAGDIKKNTELAKIYAKYVIDKGYLPIAPHLYFTQFLNEETERDLGINLGLELLKECDEIWVFGDIISQGMRKELELFSANLYQFNNPLKQIKFIKEI